MRTTLVFHKLLENQIEISDTIAPGAPGELEDLLRQIVESITRGGGNINDWYLQYRVIAINVLRRRDPNWGRVLVLILFTRAFKSAADTVTDECLLSWFENILNEFGLIEFDIPDNCFKTVWTKSSWMFIITQLLVFVYLFAL